MVALHFKSSQVHPRTMYAMYCTRVGIPVPLTVFFATAFFATAARFRFDAAVAGTTATTAVATLAAGGRQIAVTGSLRMKFTQGLL